MRKKEGNEKQKGGQSNRKISSQSLQLCFVGKYRGNKRLKPNNKANLYIAWNHRGSKSPQLRVWPWLLPHSSCSETYHLRIFQSFCSWGAEPVGADRCVRAEQWGCCAPACAQVRGRGSGCSAPTAAAVPGRAPGSCWKTLVVDRAVCPRKGPLPCRGCLWASQGCSGADSPSSPTAGPGLRLRHHQSHHLLMKGSLNVESLSYWPLSPVN